VPRPRPSALWRDEPALSRRGGDFDLASIKSNVGAPSFAPFAKEPALSLPKGGNRGRLLRRPLTLPFKVNESNGDSAPIMRE
jgi:hypothetical protein